MIFIEYFVILRDFMVLNYIYAVVIIHYSLFKHGLENLNCHKS